MLTKNGLLFFVLASSIFPAFVNLTSFKINILSVFLDAYPQEYFSPGINIHIGVLLGLGVLFTLPYLFFLRVFVPRLVVCDICVILIIIFMTTSILVGLATNAESVDVKFYFQTLAPIALYFVGAHLLKDISVLDNFPKYIVMINTMTISLMLSFLATHGIPFRPAAISGYNLAIAFPQTKDLYPVVYFMSVFFIIYIFCRGTRSIWVIIPYLMTGFLHAVFLYYLWSRGALFAAAVGMMLITVFELRDIAHERCRMAALRRFSLIYAILIVAVSSVAVFVSSGALSERYNQSSILEQSDSTRVQLAAEALKRIAESPMFGHMFIPELDTKIGETERLDVMRLFPAHNQYLDYALRGGVQSAILLIVMIIWGIWEGLRPYPVGVLSGKLDILRRYLGASIVMITIGSLFELYFVESISASITWLSLGILTRLHIERKKAAALNGYRPRLPGAYGS